MMRLFFRRPILKNILEYDHKIKIVAGSGCYSYVGFQGVNHQTISLREVGCLSRGTVQHEFMHALGFYHEQARPDASKHIQIQEQCFTSTWNKNHKILKKFAIFNGKFQIFLTEN